MEGRLVLLASLVLVLACRGVRAQLCDTCLGFECKDVNEAGECVKREYEETDWITTQLNGCSISEIWNAKYRLDDYSSANGITGGWPMLVTVTEDDNCALSYLMETNQTADTADVMWETKLKRTVHVRIFGEYPSIERARNNAQALWDGLKNNCTLPKYIAAGYPLQGLSFHNEIWIDDDDVC